MKSIIKTLTIILLVGCSAPKKNVRTPARLEVDSIEKVYLKKELHGTDSVKLSQNQIDQFVEKWNDSESKGLYKMMPKFWISIHLKNDSIRKFRVNRDLIKENGDWAFSIGDSLLISSFWTPTYSFPKPEDYTPLSFINFVSKSIATNSTNSTLGMSMTNEFPMHWVKEEHIEGLFKILESKEKCGCFLNPLSSYIPTGNAEKGGYAGIFLKSFKEEEKIDLGLYSCPKVDEGLNEELRNWWNERKK
jgi:hypothetical protein